MEGQLQTRKWQDKEGLDRYTTEIVLGRFRGELTMLDSRSSEGGGAGGGPSEEPAAAGAGGGGGASDLDDEIPF